MDKAVEALESDGGVPNAASSPLVDGSWRLIFTTTPGTASPVQRSFVGVDGFAIYQDIDLFSEVRATADWLSFVAVAAAAVAERGLMSRCVFTRQTLGEISRSKIPATKEMLIRVARSAVHLLLLSTNDCNAALHLQRVSARYRCPRR